MFEPIKCSEFFLYFKSSDISFPSNEYCISYMDINPIICNMKGDYFSNGSFFTNCVTFKTLFRSLPNSYSSECNNSIHDYHFPFLLVLAKNCYTSSALTTTANGTSKASKCFLPHLILSDSLLRNCMRSRVPFVSRTRYSV